MTDEERREMHEDVWRLVRYAKERGKSATELYIEYIKGRKNEQDTDQPTA